MVLSATEPSRIRYSLVGVKPKRNYEVRISYLGSPPAAYTVTVDFGVVKQVHPSTQRTLLDTEIMHFSSIDSTEVWVDVVASPHGRALQPELWESVTFNIIVEELVAFVPRSVLRVVAIGAVGAMIIFFYVTPRLVRALSDEAKED
jgi:hypothetical protein